MKTEARIRREIRVLINQRKMHSGKTDYQFWEVLIMERVNALKWVLENE